MVVVMAMAMAECVCMYILCMYLFFHVSGITELFFYGHVCLQFVYDCDPIQLTFLRLLSNHARQNITYHCLNSTAWFRQGSRNYEHSIRLKADNGIEIHAKGTRKYKPTVVLDECQVRSFYPKPVAIRIAYLIINYFVYHHLRFTSIT